MKLRDTFTFQGVTITIANTMRADIRKQSILSTWSKELEPESANEHNAWTMWLLASGHTEQVDGINWEPCSVMNLDALRANFDQFLNEVSPQLFNEWFDRIDQLKSPDASPLEKDDDQLTEEERNDPNSSRRGTKNKRK